MFINFAIDCFSFLFYCFFVCHNVIDTICLVYQFVYQFVYQGLLQSAILIFIYSVLHWQCFALVLLFDKQVVFFYDCLRFDLQGFKF